MSGLIFWFFIVGILYTYFGYPIILTFLAQFHSELQVNSAIEPEVTLLIAAYNEEDVIDKKIKNSLSLEYPQDKLQIIIAADGSNDNTPSIVKQYSSSGVELNYTPERRGKMVAINRAMTRVRGNIVIFSDANNMYAGDVVRQMVKYFSIPSIGAVSGTKTIITDGDPLGESESLYWKYESYIKKQETRIGTCTSAAGEIFAIRKEYYESPPSNIINDDFYLLMHVLRKGKRNIFAPEARSFEKVSSSSKDEIIRRTRIIAGRYQAMALYPKMVSWRHPLVIWQIVSHKFIRPLVPFAMIGAILANTGAVLWHSPIKNSIISLAPPFNWIFLISQVAFYLTAFTAGKIKFSGKIGKLLYIPTFLMNSNLAAMAGFRSYITGQQTVLWDRVTRKK